MPVQSLGYVGLRAKDIDDWSGYGTRLLGLQAIDRSRATLSLRMDDRKQRLIVNADGGEGIGFFGWEVEDAAALARLGAHLEAHGIEVARGARSLAEERHVADLLVTRDPNGNRLELFHGAEVAADPFRPGRNISGFRTGALGLGHVVLHVERIEEMMAFYRDVLGFRLSDYFLRPYQLYFLHVNARHHSIAFAATGKNAVHHMMLELYSLDDVGQGYDLVSGEAEEKGRLAVTLGRHCGDYVTSYYTWNPSGFMTSPAGVPATSIPRPGSRPSAAKVPASGATTARGSLRRSAPKRARCGSPMPSAGCAARCRCCREIST